MEKKFTTKVLAEVAIFAAIAFVLDILQGGIWHGIWTNGGSIGLAMVPILVICYRRGFLPGLLCGVLVALLGCLGGIYSIADLWYNVMFQVLFDYVLAYPVVAVAGLFYNPFHNAKTKKEKLIWLVTGCVLGGFLKFICHFLSGVCFWPTPDSESIFKNVSEGFVYSLVYNGTYCLPNIIICTLLIVLVDLKQPKILSLEDAQSNDQNLDSKEGSENENE